MRIQALLKHLSIAGLLLLTIGSQGFSQENYAVWLHSKNITANTSATGYGVNQDVANFPYLVRLSTADFNFSEARRNGEDLRFSDSAGTHLFYQVETWDSAGGKAAAWVLLPLVRGNNATQYFKMYWGRSTAADSSKSTKVFDTANGFSAVWHLSETPGGASSIRDATFRAIHCTPQGAMTAGNSVDGNIGKAVSFDGSDDYLSSAANANLGMTGDPAFTLTAWWKSSTFRYDGSVVSYGSAGGSRVISIVDGGGYVYSVHYGNDHLFNNAPVNVGSWYHIAIKYNNVASAESCFVNGTYRENWTPANLALTAPDLLYIGASTWHGVKIGPSIIDEVAIAKIQRSSAWIKLAYENQRVPVTAAPVVLYPLSHITVLTNTFINPLTPTITGVFDSLRIYPDLPSYFAIDQVTGTITGWAALDGVRDSAFIIRVYNEKGAGSDTLYLSFLIDTTSTRVSARGKAGSASTCLGLRNSRSGTSIIYSVASPENTAAIYFTLYNCRGTVVWKEKIPYSRILIGRQSTAVTGGRLPPGSYYLEMKTIDRKGGYNAAAMISTVIVP